MQFLALFGVMLVFGYFFPTLFKLFYWALILSVFTLGPASFLYLGAALCGMDLSFSMCCGICFLFIALPFTAKTAPE